MTALLELHDVTARYGPIEALHGVTLQVDEGQVVAVLGANGAGKTTTLRAISGTVRRDGVIRFAGRSLSHAGPDAAARSGIAHVPEGRRLWPDMSVEENLILGAYPRRARASLGASLDHVFAMFPRVAERRRQLAGTLSGGEQQMVAIGRGLMSKPSILVLDEPSLGLAPIVVAEMFEAVRRINTEGTTVLLVEQNVRQALEIATRGYVVETGRVVGSGTRDELLASDEIQKAYLGL